MYTSASAHTSLTLRFKVSLFMQIIAIIVFIRSIFITKSGGDKARNVVAGITGEK